MSTDQTFWCMKTEKHNDEKRRWEESDREKKSEKERARLQEKERGRERERKRIKGELRNGFFAFQLVYF